MTDATRDFLIFWGGSAVLAAATLGALRWALDSRRVERHERDR